MGVVCLVTSGKGSRFSGKAGGPLPTAAPMVGTAAGRRIVVPAPSLGAGSPFA